MEFETGDREYGVEEFYHQFKSQLPKIVMVNQGFYDDYGDDTFSREQVLRLHTTKRYQRVLVRSYVGKVKKTYSMSINYPKKFCLVDEGYEQSLYAIIRDKALPVKVRLSYYQKIFINGEEVSAREIPDMELIRTFTEICFLGTDIDKQGNMSPGVTKMSLCLDKITLKIVTGMAGLSKRGWKDYMATWTNESRLLAFDEEQGVEDLAHYDEGQVEKNSDISKLEPVLYTNLSLLVPKRNASSTTVPERYNQADDDNVYEHVGHVQNPETTSKHSLTNSAASKQKSVGLMQELTAVVKKAKKNIGHVLTTQPHQGTSSNIQKRDFGAVEKQKPKVAPKPKGNGKVQRGKQSVATIQYDQARINDSIDKRGVNTSNVPFTGDDSQMICETKVYDPELDYDTAKERKLIYDQGGHAEVYSRTSDWETVTKSDGRYINTDSMAIVTPMSQQQDATYANCSDIRQSITQHRSMSRSTSQPIPSRQSTRIRLSQEEIHDLSIDELGEYLRRLNLDAAVETFRENQIDGKLLTELTDDILKTEFQLKPLQVVKLKTFIKEGHIPQ